jgi:hypothetical protein
MTEALSAFEAKKGKATESYIYFIMLLRYDSKYFALGCEPNSDK